MSDNNRFFEMVQASPTLTERMVATTEHVVQAARELFGVNLTLDDVANLPTIRASILGNMPLNDDYLVELEVLPAVQARLPKISTKAEKPKSAPNASDKPLDENAWKRKAMASMNAARGGKNEKKEVDHSAMSDVDKLRYLQTLPPGDWRKMHFARLWNLVPQAQKNGH
jgi:hypothetical protein